MSTATNTEIASREIVSERLVDAPPEQVFEAFRKPERLARWWGPKDFRSTFERFEFRPGGTWEFVMHGPDGTEYPNRSVFREIVAPSRVVFEHFGHHFMMTITLDAKDGKTLVGWHMLFDDAPARDKVAEFVIPANEQNLDRLQAEIAS